MTETRGPQDQCPRNHNKWSKMMEPTRTPLLRCKTHPLAWLARHFLHASVYGGYTLQGPPLLTNYAPVSHAGIKDNNGEA